MDEPLVDYIEALSSMATYSPRATFGVNALAFNQHFGPNIGQRGKLNTNKGQNGPAVENICLPSPYPNSGPLAKRHFIRLKF